MQYRKRLSIVAGLAVAAGAGISPTAQAQSYTITNIPTLDFYKLGDIYALGISSTGLVTGYFNTELTNATQLTFPDQEMFIAQVSKGAVTEESVGYLNGNVDPNNPSDPDNPIQFAVGQSVNSNGVVAGTVESAYDTGFFQNNVWNGNNSEVGEFTGNAISGLGALVPASLPASPLGGRENTFNITAAINNNGNIVGGAWTLNPQDSAVVYPANQGKERIHAFVYTPASPGSASEGTYTDLSLGSYQSSTAYGINSTGTEVVGFLTAGTYHSVSANAQPAEPLVSKQATIWTKSNGTWTSQTIPNTLPTVAGDYPTVTNSSGQYGIQQSVAFAVNNSGEVVGCAETDLGAGIQGDAFLYQPSTGKMIDLTSSIATANGPAATGSGVTGATGSGTLQNLITNSNGFSGTLAPSSSGNPLNSGLGSYTSCADAINNNGQIVGSAVTTAEGTQAAILATVNAQGVPNVIDLNTLLPANSPWYLQEATGINDAGQIVGYGIYNDKESSFELDPAPVGTWNATSSGSWSSSSNWTGGLPNGVGVNATFGAGPSSSSVITLDGSKTVGHLDFNNTNAYTLNAGTGGTLTIDDTNDISGACPTIIVAAGNHAINVPIVLATNNGSMGVTVNTFQGTSLTLTSSVSSAAGPVSNTSAGLNVIGSGTLILAPTAVLNVPLIASGGQAPDTGVAAANCVTFQASTNLSAGILVRTIPSISITSGGTVVEVSPAVTPASRQLIVTSALNITKDYPEVYFGSNQIWMGTLDLANNDMIVLNGNLADISSQIAQGYDGGKWDGSPIKPTFGGYPGYFNFSGGIISTTAAADTSHLTALGVIPSTGGANGSAGTFDGQTVPVGSVLMKYTYYGDANLDGTVNSADYSLVDYAFLYNQTHPNDPLTGWYNGDFNYDGVTNGSDYTLMDNAFNQQGAAISTEVAVSTVQIAGQITAQTAGAAVPEPALGTLLGTTALSLLRRRRRVS